jgi:hypothetical protein
MPYREEWRGTLSSKLLKGQNYPQAVATANTVEIHQRNYIVTFYVQGTSAEDIWIDGVAIFGWPDNDAMERVLEEWDIPVLRSSFAAKVAWLEQNPGFKRFPKKTPQKRVYASQTEL